MYLCFVFSCYLYTQGTPVCTLNNEHINTLDHVSDCNHFICKSCTLHSVCFVKVIFRAIRSLATQMEDSPEVWHSENFVLNYLHGNDSTLYLMYPLASNKLSGCSKKSFSSSMCNHPFKDMSKIISLNSSSCPTNKRLTLRSHEAKTLEKILFFSRESDSRICPSVSQSVSHQNPSSI